MLKSGSVPHYSPVAILVERAESQPGAPALIGAGGMVSYAALLRGVREGAAWLHGCGVRSGDTVAYALELAPERFVRQVELFYAIAYLGAAILPLYPGAAAARRGALVARFDARWLIASQGLESAACATRLDPAQFDADRGRWPEGASARGDDPALPFLFEFSSGTTGTPKVVLFTGEQYAENSVVAARQYDWRESDRVVTALRWPTKVGLRGLLRAHSAGAALVDEHFPDTRGDLARLVEDLGVTCVGSSPWQLRRLLASDRPAGAGRARLRFLSTGGACTAPQEIRAARETLTPGVHVVYSITEIGMVARLRPEDAADASPRLIPGMEGAAMDEDGRPLPPGRAGRLRFRAPWMSTGYAGNEDATAECYRDGWFHTGDLGSIDAAGGVALRGRADDIINFGGAKILPRDVERELEAHPAVVEAALVGVPDAMAGEIAVAFVVLRDAVTPEALGSFLAERLDEGQIPAAVGPIDEMPRNPEGKILRERLREIYLAWQARSRSG